MPSLFRPAFAILCASVASALAQQPPAAEKPEPKPLLHHVDLKDGDTLVFLGDSITHQCLYTQYVEDYFYTRYPKLRVHFHNAGVGGDRAQDALNRFDGDVAAFKPKYVTILLGMNDGAYTRYEQPIFDTYQHGMTSLLEQIAGLGATAIPMTPTMFDSLPSKLGKNPNVIKETYYNGVLALYGSWLREQAFNQGLGFVDMWSPLNDHTLERRRTDAKWTMIPDGVHPAPTGQVVMAEAIVHDVVPHTPVSQITVEERGGQPAVSGVRGTAGPVRKEGSTVSFDFTAESLPWVLPPEAEEGAKLALIGHHDSNEKLTVRNLPTGRYEVKIDGQSVGAWTDGQLAYGVELEEDKKTPEYQQALQVALLNQQRNKEAYHPLRDLWAQRKGRINSLNKAKETQAANIAEVQASFDQSEEEMKPKVEALLQKARGLEDEIYKANQPALHHYEISPAGAPEAPKAQ